MLNKVFENFEFAKNALLGTIMADGSIEKQRTSGIKGVAAPLEITHTSKNLDYIKFIGEILKFLNIEYSINEHNKSTETKTYQLFRLYTERTEWFKELRDIIYDENRVKMFPESIYRRFNKLSLLLLYLDDGTLRVRFYPGTSKIREARISLCLDSFTYEELMGFKKYLEETWGIKTGIYRHSKNLPNNRGFRLWTNTENTKKFMEIIDEYYELIPSMQYKYLKYYLL